MMCEKCGAIRILTKKKVLCPNCDKVELIDSKKAIQERELEMGRITSKFSEEIDSTNYNQTFGSAIVNRELAAKAVLFSPIVRTYAVEEWLAYTYLLRNLRYSQNKGISNFLEIIDDSRRIVRLYNEILSLKQGSAVLVRSESQESLEWTENEPLSFVPDEVYQEDPRLKHTLKEKFSDRELNIESVMLQEGLMLPIWRVLLSEDISRTLKRCTHSRLLPFIKNASEAMKFVEISLVISAEGIKDNVIQGVDAQAEGLILTDERSLLNLQRNLWDKFHSEDIKWYFRSLRSKPSVDKFDFSSALIVTDEQTKIVCLPLYSLLMLGQSTVKWLKKPDIGRALNFQGEVVEDYFYRFANAYNICLNHPTSKQPLLRVKHPDLPIEIADIMGYNNSHVLALECKFWNAPTLSALEKELAKFEEKVKYIQENLDKFGLSKSLKVVPMFYTPYAPYPAWHKIRLLPTALTFGIKLGEIFSAKKPKLVEKVVELEKLHDLVTGPAPFPIDASYILESLPPNRYNVHDGLVLEYDKNEVTVFIDLPVSLYGFFGYLDISNETFNELKLANISSGDIIE